MSFRKIQASTFSPILSIFILFSMLTLFSPAAAQVCRDSVTVVFGDTLSGIADRCNTYVDDLMEANPQLASPHRLQVGMTLKMPEPDGVETEDLRSKEKSDPYQVQPEEGGNGRNRSDLIEVRGMLTREGVECQAMRGEDGELYTFSGIGNGYGPGDCVTVVGKAAQISFCQQGTTLDVKRIEKR